MKLNTTIRTTTFALIIAAVSLIGSAHAAIMLAGFDYGTSTSPLQTGFTQVSSGTAITTDALTGISITASRATTARDRTDPGGALNNLITDLHFIGDSDPVTFTLSGLAPNTTYEITAYAWDPESGNNGKELTWTTNGGAVSHTNVSSDPSTAAFNLAPLTTNALGVGIITGEHTGGPGGSAILWNGFAIIVPEPASMALLGLSGLFFMGRRRR